jgi:hypothetical protein
MSNPMRAGFTRETGSFPCNRYWEQDPAMVAVTGLEKMKSLV